MNHELQLTLSRHEAADEVEAQHLRAILAFAERHVDPFDRTIREGHLTGSAFVVSSDGEALLLLHHRKLDRWLQPGGHAAPGETSALEVALREAREETHLEGLFPHPRAPRPLDVDVHVIPARREEPEHAHLDLRFLLVAPRNAEARHDPAESLGLRWFAWAELHAIDLDTGTLRALTKVRAIVGHR